jgi:hypothetical protein
MGDGATRLAITKPLEHPLRRVPLLAVNLPITVQPPVDDPGEAIQLRLLDRCRSPISRWNRKRHHLGYALARDAEMPRRLSLAHALSTGQPNLPIQIYSERLPADAGSIIWGNVIPDTEV